MGDKNEVVLHTRVQALMETGETAGELAPRQPKLSFSPTNSKPMAGSKRQSQLHTLKTKFYLQRNFGDATLRPMHHHNSGKFLGADDVLTASGL